MQEPLPELLQAEWGRDQVMALFQDLRDGAEVKHVQVRTSSSDRAASLAEALQLFISGEATAIQVRYNYDDQYWIDTILPGDPTIKILRNRLQEDF